MSLFEYLRQHPDQAREFGMGMSGVSAPVIRLAADHIEPGAARTVVDVGGAEVGDFFTAVPPGDLYLLKFVPHNWDDEECVRILSTIRAAMPAGTRLFVVEMVADDDRIGAGPIY